MGDVVPIPQDSAWDKHLYELMHKWRAKAEAAGEILSRPVKPPLAFPDSPQQLRLPFDVETFYIRPR